MVMMTLEAQRQALKVVQGVQVMEQRSAVQVYLLQAVANLTLLLPGAVPSYPPAYCACR